MFGLTGGQARLLIGVVVGLAAGAIGFGGFVLVTGLPTDKDHPCLDQIPSYLQVDVGLVQGVAPPGSTDRRVDIWQDCWPGGYSFGVTLTFQSNLVPLDSCRLIRERLIGREGWSEVPEIKFLPEPNETCLFGFDGPTGAFTASVETSGRGMIAVQGSTD